MTDSNKKRKEILEDDRDKKGFKRSKGGSGGKWQTPHQAAKEAARGSGRIEPGEVGIWATCARGQEGRATTELKHMFQECAERFYGIPSESGENAEYDAEEVDIEAAIQKEVASMSNNEKPKLFSPVHLDIECVLFFKTQPPIEPVDFVHRICEEVVSTPGIKRMKYVNRLTPNTLIAKATERGLAELGKAILGKHFKLTGEEANAGAGDQQYPAHSYAIRPTTRAHTLLARDVLIKTVASMIDNSHQVNLTKPDTVILIEVYQSICGMSVVDGDWETLKRFNLAELYKTAPKTKAHQPKTKAMPEPVTKNENQPHDSAIADSSGTGELTEQYSA